MTPEFAKGLAELFVGQLEQEYAITKKILAAVPEGQMSYKLGEKGKTLGELMWHIVDSDVWFAVAIAAGGEFSAPEGGSKAPDTVREMVASYEERFPPLLARIKLLSGEQLAKVINFYNVYHLPLVLYMPFLASHSIHHRGQLSTYIRSLNAYLPSIYGGSADEPMQAPATA